MQNILVVGANGFLGSHVSKMLYAKSDFINIYAGIRANSDLSRFNILNSNLKSEIVNLDITNSSELSHTFKYIKPDVVVNCSAYGVNYSQKDLKLALNTNIQGTEVMMKLCNEYGTKKYINIGTSFEYGNNRNGIGYDTQLNPNNFYGVIKASQSLLVKYLSSLYKLQTVNIKPFTMFGPLENKYKLFPLVWNSIQNSNNINLTHGEQLRDYIHVEDVADFIAEKSTEKSDKLYEEMLIGSQKSYTLKEFCNLIIKISGSSNKLLLWGEKKYREDEIFFNHSIQEKTHTLEASLESSISKTLDFYNKTST